MTRAPTVSDGGARRVSGSPVEARPPHAAAPSHPSFADAFRFWAKLGFINFGGPAGQIAIMHAELVERRRWISEERFLHALSYCMVLPGPEAQQLAIYVGWLLHGTAGGVAAGSLFVLPSLALLLGLSWLYAAHGTLPAVQAALLGVKPVVIAIILVALWRIGSRALKTPALVALALVGFAAIRFLGVPFPLIVLGAGLVTLAAHRLRPGLVVGAPPGHGTNGGSAAQDAVLDREPAAGRHVDASVARAIQIAVTFAALWLAPVLAIAALRSRVPVLFDEALFFTKAAWVTIGGAYAVLPYIAFAGISRYGWLTAGQMIDGLALGETTPGPLIMVTTFVGFLGAWHHPGVWTPAAAGLLGGVITTYFTFLFSFFFIFLGAPWIERFRTHAPLAAALTGVTAAIVGVIANLAAYLGVHVFVRAGRPEWAAVVLFALAVWALFVRRWSIHWVVAGGAVAGLVLAALGGWL